MDYAIIENLVEVKPVKVDCVKRVRLCDLNSSEFIGLFREVSKGLFRLIDVGIRGYENDYIKEGDIPVVITEELRFGDELIVGIDI